jgi:hypothetical protein
MRVLQKRMSRLLRTPCSVADIRLFNNVWNLQQSPDVSAASGERVNVLRAQQRALKKLVRYLHASG